MKYYVTDDIMTEEFREVTLKELEARSEEVTGDELDVLVLYKVTANAMYFEQAQYEC